MKVLMIGRSTLNTSPGGDTVQINSTAKYLKKLGVNVEVKLANDIINYQSFNLIHFFNIIRPDDILPHISKSNLPFVVSTIFVDYSEYEKANRKSLLKLITHILNDDQIEYAKAIARFVINGDRINSLYYLLRGHRASIKHVAAKASLLLPNSTNEYNRFVRKYGVGNKYLKIPNAIDREVFNDNVLPDDEFSNHILCVGRIEGRKNQLNLIKALINTDLKLTIVGKPSPNHMAYYQECKALAAKSKNIRILEHASHQALAAMFKAAKVHVLPSWFETTGLSSLEAGMMDCNIVVTTKGDTEEYFKDMAYYCDPSDVASIKSAILNAFHDLVKPELKHTIAKQYTWEVAAQETLKAYQTVLP